VHIKPLVMVNPGDVDTLDDIINTDILRDRSTICLFADGAMDRGGLIVGGSDASVTPMNPLQGIFACVNHPIERHRITRHEALRLFTINGAMIGFEENFKGFIENGKLADFVVLCDDIYQVPPDKIGDIRVEMTIVGGKIVYQTD